MNRYSKHTLWFSLVVVLFFAACGQDPAPAPQAKVQTKKIISRPEQTQPKTGGNTAPSPNHLEAAVAPRSEMEASNAPPAQNNLVEKQLPETAPGAIRIVPPSAAGLNEANQPKTAAAVISANPAVPPGTMDDASNLIQAVLQIAGTYDPTGRFDPFEPLIKEKPQAAAFSSGDPRKKRTPQTPLEQVALAQLKLSAIIRAPSGNRALVEDATGKGYVVEKGTYMGLNAGQVVQIEKDRLIVEEEVENVSGELSVQATELKLQKPAGEL